jgi:diguanylate cyclase (GGDEF)-like protein
MPHRLLKSLGLKQSDATGATPGAPSVSPLTTAALELAQELLRGVEHFVLSTPDLDAPRFLERIRRMAAELTPVAKPEEVERQRRWAVESLSVFGQLQRRYLTEREDELWRLLSLYQDNVKAAGSNNKQFTESLQTIHERMGDAVRLDDLRQVRERLEGEIQKASTLVEQKVQADQELSTALISRVEQLEAALTAARHEASRDALTGVYHRGGFETQLEAALQSPHRVALALIDVDNFKGINDTAGHLVGDQILKMAVQSLARVARPGDVIGRFGGDEFCLMAPQTSPERLADRLDGVAAQRTINMQFEERLCSVRLSLSVGVAGSVPGDTARTLFDRADAALYEAKRGGKGHTRVAPEPEAQMA